MLRLKLESLVEDIEFLRRNMGLIGVLDSEKIQDTLKDSVYFKTVDCDPMMFRLETDSVYSPKVMWLIIDFLGRYSFIPSYLLVLNN